MIRTKRLISHDGPAKLRHHDYDCIFRDSLIKGAQPRGKILNLGILGRLFNLRMFSKVMIPARKIDRHDRWIEARVC